MSKTWYITGASRGFGHAWATAALERGDRVAATARDTSSLKGLVDVHGDAVLPVQLDVTDRAASFAALQQAHRHFGRLDVVVNNAGYGHFGFVEELTEAEALARIETNVFGALWTTQAAIPLLRAQDGGHLLQVSSMGGAVAFPSLGMYHASKWALEGLTEALSAEVSMFGIRTTIIEPGGYATDWSGASAAASTAMPEYQPIRDAMTASRAGSTSPGAEASVEALFTVVDADEPPARLLLNSVAFDMVTSIVEHRRASSSSACRPGGTGRRSPAPPTASPLPPSRPASPAGPATRAPSSPGPTRKRVWREVCGLSTLERSRQVDPGGGTMTAVRQLLRGVAVLLLVLVPAATAWAVSPGSDATGWSPSDGTTVSAASGNGFDAVQVVLVAGASGVLAVLGTLALSWLLEARHQRPQTPRALAPTPTLPEAWAAAGVELVHHGWPAGPPTRPLLDASDGGTAATVRIPPSRASEEDLAADLSAEPGRRPAAGR